MLKSIKMLLSLLMLVFTLSFSPASIHAVGIKARSSPTKYKISACSLFRNEGRYLKEWIEYHRLIGIDHFYLYNNASIDNSVEVLTPYIEEGLVTLIYWPNYIPDELKNDITLWALSTQLPAYQHAAKYAAAKETEWLVTLEIDEFLVPVQSQSIKEIVNSHKQFPGLLLASEFYNASRNDGVLRQKLVTETIELTSAPAIPVEKSIEKIIFRPDCHTSFTWPPYKCQFKENKIARKAYKAELRLNKYVNRPKSVLNFGKIKDKLRVDNRTLSEEETYTLLKDGFEIEDQERPIYRFLPELLRRMHIEPGWNL